MPDAIDVLLNNAVVRDALKQAWLDSNPGESGRHETGGFIVRDANGVLGVVRWPEGTQKEISVPVHTGCMINDNVVIASFHTHPNSGANYFQEPSGRDIDEVQFDPDLMNVNCVGEFVLSAAIIYFILPNGGVVELGKTAQTLGV